MPCNADACRQCSWSPRPPFTDAASIVMAVCAVCAVVAFATAAVPSCLAQHSRRRLFKQRQMRRRGSLSLPGNCRRVVSRCLGPFALSHAISLLAVLSCGISVSRHRLSDCQTVTDRHRLSQRAQNPAIQQCPISESVTSCAGPRILCSIPSTAMHA